MCQANTSLLAPTASAAAIRAPRCARSSKWMPAISRWRRSLPWRARYCPRLCSATGSTPGRGPPGSGSGASFDLERARLADRAREVEHRARQRHAVVERAHHGVRSEHLHAERAHAFGEGEVLAVDDEAVGKLAVFRRRAERGGLAAQLAHHLAG